MHRVVRLLRFVPTLFAVVAVVACSAPANTAAPTQQAGPASAPAPGKATTGTASGAFSGNFDGGTVVFGAPISLTGSMAKEGGYVRDGYDLWRDTYNQAGGINIGGKHYKIETKYYDDASDAQKSATLADKLIKEDKVNFILG